VAGNIQVFAALESFEVLAGEKLTITKVTIAF